ncbi:helix-turn-helix domain-containing protein [Edaphovirga cremea]|uniref:helix-turn-helix domain-containing protein n=1 Tax=Edaphovirga cremea TaxID=2267246 RepID=UPI000DEF8D62|nr:LuxR C-terminal-related transcriptional regulator [Edaphovirga cremea]
MTININIVTENIYFFNGIKEHLQDDEHVVNRINPDELKNLPGSRFKEEDIFIFYTSNYLDELSFLISRASFAGRLIFIPTNSEVKFNSAFRRHTFLDAYAGIEIIRDKIAKNPVDEEFAMDLMRDKLTEREKIILLHTINGMNAYSIGQFLRISIKTVYAHRRNAFLKLGGRNMFEICPVRTETLRTAIF